MIKRVTALFFLLLANILLLGHSIIILEHCHLFTNSEFYSTYISQLKYTKQLKRSVNVSLIETGSLVLNRRYVIKKVNLDLPFLITSSFKQGATVLRGPPVV